MRPEEFIVSREQYDRLQIAMVQLMFDCPAEMAPDAIRHSYPVTTSIAIDEVRKRGLAANTYQVGRFIERHPDAVPLVGKMRIWSREAIDLFCSELAATGVYTPQALKRRETGTTAQQAVDEIAAKLDEQIAEAKAAIESEEQACHRMAENVIGQKAVYQSN